MVIDSLAEDIGDNDTDLILCYVRLLSGSTSGRFTPFTYFI